MNYITPYENLLDEFLSEYAVRRSAGRQKTEPPCPMRTDFQRDRDRIIHCKAFRRLKHKTQAFIAPEGDHYRTRLTHTLEVSQIARTISRCLRLNEDLTEAIALCHDLGHTPFGHEGERALQSRTNFCHNRQSLRVVDILERSGAGMNLTKEVRNGALCHTGDTRADTLEGRVVAIADRIAYINHDIDDSLRAGVISGIPREFEVYFGATNSERISTMILDIINNSLSKPDISPSEICGQKMNGLRSFLFEKVYFGACKSESDRAEELIQRLYDYLYAHPDLLPATFSPKDTPLDIRVCDYISSMTDNYCIRFYEQLFIPRSWGAST